MVKKTAEQANADKVAELTPKEEELTPGAETELSKVEPGKLEAKPVIDWEAKLAEITGNYQAMQRNIDAVFKKTVPPERLQAIEDVLEEQRAMMQSLMEQGGLEGLTPEAEKRLKTAQTQREIDLAKAEIKAILREGELSDDDSEVDKIIVGTKSPAEAFRKASAVVRASEKAKRDQTEAERKADLARREREKREREGELEVGAGAISVGVGEEIPTDMVQFRKWIADVPQKEYEEKYAKKVNEMMRKGKIK